MDPRGGRGRKKETWHTPGFLCCTSDVGLNAASKFIPRYRGSPCSPFWEKHLVACLPACPSSRRARRRLCIVWACLGMGVLPKTHRHL